METKNNRRQFLKLGAGAAGALTLIPALANALGAATCGPVTPTQTSGPFFPGEPAFQPDTDLTQIPGNPKRAIGQVVYVRGVVTDQLCQPVAGAMVEIWQACASGRYNNPRDPNTAPLDPNFKYWGKAFTDAQGAYMFKTIVPGWYPADVDWNRPPHIHFKVSRLGYRELITQMYFKGEKFNDDDLILQAIPPEERGTVIVEFVPAPADMEPGALIGDFPITMRSVKPGTIVGTKPAPLAP